MIKTYYDIPDSMIDKIKVNLKKELDTVFRQHKNEDWSDFGLGGIDADIYFPRLMTQFEKVVKEKDVDVVRDWCFEFMDDIYNQDVDDFINECLEKYHIEINELRGHSVRPPHRRAFPQHKRATPKKRVPAVKVNVRKMF